MILNEYRLNRETSILEWVISSVRQEMPSTLIRNVIFTTPATEDNRLIYGSVKELYYSTSPITVVTGRNKLIAATELDQIKVSSKTKYWHLL